MAADPVPRQVRRYYAMYYLLPMERFDEAAAECERSLVDDPLDLTARIRFAQCLYAAGRQQDAYAELSRVLAIDEQLWFTHFILGLHQLRDGQLADAVRHAERAHALAPWSPSASGLLAAAWRLNGDARCETIIEALRSRPVYGTAMALALYHLVGSEIDDAADWTAKVIGERHAALFFFLYGHADTLRRSPRWPALARLLNLPSVRPREV
jgi:tetratricopeptide (TPR) repeat protein